MTLFKTRTALF